MCKVGVTAVLGKAQLRALHVGPGDPSKEVRGESVQNDSREEGRCLRVEGLGSVTAKPFKLLSGLSGCLWRYFPSQGLIYLTDGFLPTHLRLMAHRAPFHECICAFLRLIG